MSDTRTRHKDRRGLKPNDRRGLKPNRKMRLLRRRKLEEDGQLQTAADFAVNAMAKGIRDEFELEDIVRKARPHLRDRVRERLIPHLSFEVRPRIERV